MYMAHFHERCLKAADAGTRRLFRSFPAQLLDWMWETLEETVDALATRWPFLLTFYDFEKWCEGVDSKQQGVYRDISAILKDTEFRHRLELLLVASKTIGKQARWMMGCHCHESVLQGIKDYSARRAKLISVGVVGGVCPWACRRGGPCLRESGQHRR